MYVLGTGHMYIKEEFATCKQGCRYHTDAIHILLLSATYVNTTYTEECCDT
jgi:hypothetical protein